jgi:hypothetical protein
LFADQPERTEGVEPSDLPTYFDVEVRAGESAPEALGLSGYSDVREVTVVEVDSAEQLANTPLVDGLIVLWYPRAHDVVVFFGPDTPQVTVAQAEGAAGTSLVAAEFFDRARTVEDFKRVFADEPDLLRQADELPLPVSLRGQIDLRQGSDMLSFDGLPEATEVFISLHRPEQESLLGLTKLALNTDVMQNLSDETSLKGHVGRLADAVSRWLSAPEDLRSRGTLYSVEEIRSFAESAAVLAAYARQSCGFTPASSFAFEHVGT